MRKFINTCPLTLLAATVICFSSCKKDTDETPVDVVFSVSTDGYMASFADSTAGAVSYNWDFGDGSTSTEANPTHIYAAKGKYVPTLTVTTDKGMTAEASTVLRISKGSAVDLHDNTLSDWDTVVTNAYVSPAEGLAMRASKYDYDGENIYFYFEMATTKDVVNIFDFYIDSDNDFSTGLVTWLWNNAGNDILLEGDMLAGWFDAFYHKGEQTAFTFDVQSIPEFYELGTVVQDGSILKMEGRLVRSKLKGLTGKGVKIGFTLSDASYTPIGFLPKPASPSFSLDMSE